jgi:hypothetical protein
MNTDIYTACRNSASIETFIFVQNDQINLQNYIESICFKTQTYIAEHIHNRAQAEVPPYYFAM